jgi:hypothetical protein
VPGLPCWVELAVLRMYRGGLPSLDCSLRPAGRAAVNRSCCGGTGRVIQFPGAQWVGLEGPKLSVGMPTSGLKCTPPSVCCNFGPNADS